ncbi:MAG: hypothetical protein ACI4KH_02160 [Oscillospiraceae bacterium]
MKKQSVRLLSGSPSDLLVVVLRSYITYFVTVGGVWLILGLISLIANPQNGFNSLFNQKEAFIYSLLAFTALVIRQKVGEYLCARMNVFVAEALSLLLGGLLFALFFSRVDFNFRSNDISVIIVFLILVILRYIPLQSFFDKGIVRRGKGMYEQFARVRRKNFLPAFMSLMVFLGYALFRYPKPKSIIFGGVFLELIIALITAEIIKRRTKANRIPSEAFGNAQNIVLDIHLAELCENAFIRKGEIHKSKESIKYMFNSNGYGFSGNTLIIDLDTFIFCKDILPVTDNRNVLIHIGKSLEKYGADAVDRLEKITAEFIEKGFVVYFQKYMDSKTTMQYELENRLSGRCVFLNKNTQASLETVINSSGGYSQKCADHIREVFSKIYSSSSVDNLLCNTVNLQLKELINEYSLLDMFYELIQAVELCVHLTCLCALSEGIKCNAKDTEQLSFGKMIEITRRCTPNEKIADENLKNSVKFIETLCNIKGGGTINETRVFQTVVSLRNRYLGHGTMTYSVSEELVYNLTDICAYIVKICCELLTERFSKIDLTSEIVPFTDVKSALVVENQMYFYSCFFGNGKAEYINPLNGQLYQNCSRRVISTCMNRGDELKGSDKK